MSVNPTYRTYVLEQLSPLGPVTAKAMFGGLGLYHDGRFFGLLYDDTLYLKVDDTTRGDYEAVGAGPFRPPGAEGASMNYYEVPGDVLEDAARLAEWARAAVEVARRKAATRAKRPKPRK